MPHLRITLGILLCPSLLAAQDPLFHRLATREGLPSNTVYTMAQDHDGFVWFGTSNGAVRVDGSHVDRFGLDEGMTDAEVFVVHPDSRGRMWFLTGNGRPCYYDHGRVMGPTERPELGRVWLRSGVRSVHEDRTGAYWFGGFNGDVAVLDAEGAVTVRSIMDPVGKVNGGHITLAPDGAGGTRMFCGPYLVPQGRDKDRKAREDTALADGTMRLFPNGRLIGSGTWCVKEWQDTAWVQLFDARDLGRSGRFRRAYPVGPDEVWLSLQEGGVCQMKRIRGRWQDVRGVLFQDDLVNDVMRDRDGNIWIATAFTGVIMITAAAEQTMFYRGQGPAGEEFLRVTLDTATGRVWCGTNQGDLYRLDHGLVPVDLPPAGAHFNRVNDLLVFGPDVFVATDETSWRLDPSGRVKEIQARNPYRWKGLMRGPTKAYARGPADRLFASFYGLYEFNWREEVLERVDPDLAPEVRVYAPVFDRAGTLWYEDQGHLLSLRDAVLTAHPEVDLPPGIRITDMVFMGDTLVMATSGRGLWFHHRGRMVRRVGRPEGLASEAVNHVFAEGGELFVATDQGLDRITGLATGTPRVQHEAMAMGGLSHAVRDVAVDRGHVYALLENGLCVLPRNGHPHPVGLPVPYLRRVLINDSLVSERSIVGIRRGRDRLVVGLAAVRFSEPEGVVLEYRIDPDQPWQRAFGGLLDLSAQEAGDHRLQVRAAWRDGPWSTPAEMGVVIIPRLSERWWARVLLVIALVSATFLLLRRFAARRLRRREERLRERELVAHERQRIAMDLHDDLGAELSSLLLLTRLQRHHPVPGGLDRLEQLAGTLTEKMKEVIWSTDPGHDTLEATISFILKHATTLCAQHGLSVRTVIAPRLPATELSAGMRRELFLLAKEALNNTLKHSGATTLTLEARVVNDAVELVIADDGHGFEGAGNGRGLQNMAERARAIGATLQVDGRSSGTRITLRLPLPAHRPNG